MLKENQIGHEPNIKILLALYFPCIFHLFFFCVDERKYSGQTARKDRKKRAAQKMWRVLLFCLLIF